MAKQNVATENGCIEKILEFGRIIFVYIIL